MFNVGPKIYIFFVGPKHILDELLFRPGPGEDFHELQTMAEERRWQSWFWCVAMCCGRWRQDTTLDHKRDEDETTAAIGTSLIAGVWSEKTRALHNSRLSKIRWRQAKYRSDLEAAGVHDRCMLKKSPPRSIF